MRENWRWGFMSWSRSSVRQCESWNRFREEEVWGERLHESHLTILRRIELLLWGSLEVMRGVSLTKEEAKHEQLVFQRRNQLMCRDTCRTRKEVWIDIQARIEVALVQDRHLLKEERLMPMDWGIDFLRRRLRLGHRSSMWRIDFTNRLREGQKSQWTTILGAQDSETVEQGLETAEHGLEVGQDLQQEAQVTKEKHPQSLPMWVLDYIQELEDGLNRKRTGLEAIDQFLPIRDRRRTSERKKTVDPEPGQNQLQTGLQSLRDSMVRKGWVSKGKEEEAAEGSRK